MQLVLFTLCCALVGSALGQLNPYRAGQYQPYNQQYNQQYNPYNGYNQYNNLYNNQYQGQYQGQYYQRNAYNRAAGASAPILQYSNDVNPDGSFQYSYQTGDGISAQAAGFTRNAGYKDAEAQVVQGSYSYTGPDGVVYSVNYIADENGYRAEGAHLPSPPAVAAEAVKSLAYNRGIVPAALPAVQPAAQPVPAALQAYQQPFNAYRSAYRRF